MPLTSSDYPSGKDRRVVEGGRRLGDHPAIARLRAETVDLADRHAMVLGRVAIVAVIGWLLAAAEFVMLIYSTGGFR